MINIYEMDAVRKEQKKELDRVTWEGWKKPKSKLRRFEVKNLFTKHATRKKHYRECLDC